MFWHLLSILASARMTVLDSAGEIVWLAWEVSFAEEDVSLADGAVSLADEVVSLADEVVSLADGAVSLADEVVGDVFQAQKLESLLLRHISPLTLEVYELYDNEHRSLLYHVAIIVAIYNRMVSALVNVE